MNLPCASAALAVAFGVVGHPGVLPPFPRWVGQDGGAAAPAKQEPAPTLGSGNVEKLSKMVRTYYSHLDENSHGDAKKEIDKIVEEANKIAKAQKIADPLLALDDWREIVKRGLFVEKPTIVPGRGDLKLVALTEKQTPANLKGADSKEALAVFDNKMKAFASVPSDFTKVAYPVIIALHPAEEEVKTIKEMRKSGKVVEDVEKWVKAKYSKEVLSKAIVVAPILDTLRRSSDGVSYTRPRWDSQVGTELALRSLGMFVFPNGNHDVRRVYFDGEGSGAAAALQYCAQFPGLQTGCIVRGAPPENLEVDNCSGSPILLVGKETQAFYELCKSKEGFVVDAPVESLDDATLLQWMTAHPKNFSPSQVKLRTTNINFAQGYWFRVTEDDRSNESLPIVVDASIDRAKNQITIVTNERVKAFEVFLNDELVDLSKEVRVVHRRSGGEPDAPETERFKGVVKRVIEDMLSWRFSPPYLNSGDLYVACIPVQLH